MNDPANGSPENNQRDASSGFIWPPVIYTLAVVGGYLLYQTTNIPMAPEGLSVALRIAGWIVILVGIAIAVWAEVVFLIAKTATLPIHSTSTIVTSGVYRYTRNPMYLAMSLFTAGLALVFNSIFFLLTLAIAVYAVTRLAIEPEERYLERKFGGVYLDYKAKVRRWF